jgi:hypothetical protein
MALPTNDAAQGCAAMSQGYQFMRDRDFDRMAVVRLLRVLRAHENRSYRLSEIL